MISKDLEIILDTEYSSLVISLQNNNGVVIYCTEYCNFYIYDIYNNSCFSEEFLTYADVGKYINDR